MDLWLSITLNLMVLTQIIMVMKFFWTNKKLKEVSEKVDKLVLMVSYRTAPPLEPIATKPLLTKKARTDEMRRKMSQKKKEWWANKKAQGKN